MAETSISPVLNPVLTFQMEPRPQVPIGGGKKSSNIVRSRLQKQREWLVEKCREVFRQRESYPAFAGKIHLYASMFDDSLAPSYTPHDLFNLGIGCRLVAPFTQGYLMEATLDQVPNLAERINEAKTIGLSVDISRVEDLGAFDRTAMLRGYQLDDMWESSHEGDEGKLFTIWLVPFQSVTARDELLDAFENLSAEGVLKPVFPILQQIDHTALDERDESPAPILARNQTSIARALRTYQNTGYARATVAIQHKEDLETLTTSGTIFRIDPMKRLFSKTQTESKNLGPPVPDVSDEPIVAVIDGGLTSRSYRSAEAWVARPFIGKSQADGEHGNKVSSLIVHGHQWNPTLSLPHLNCRIGTVRAIPNSSTSPNINIERLPDYLEGVASAHPETHIWNMSANVTEPEEDVDLVSVLGDSMSKLARSLNILPVISIGNVSQGNLDRLCAPADCEAALVVGGRLAEEDGNPGDRAPYCLQGPGPDGMLKPDLSSFSTVRLIGNVVDCGSSYAAPLVSVLAAHTFANLKEPTPDIVRALLINASEQGAHDAALGWGTPYWTNLPWNCAPGSVTLVWRAFLKPGIAYYWNDIPIPPELIIDDKLKGVASLTGVLKPITSPYGGPNYFITRLQTALQYQDNKGEWDNLLGSMKESSLPEPDARERYAKWHPVRRMRRDFSKSTGLGFSGTKLRLYSRVYTRDLFQFGIKSQSDLDARRKLSSHSL